MTCEVSATENLGEIPPPHSGRKRCGVSYSTGFASLHPWLWSFAPSGREHVQNYGISLELQPARHYGLRDALLHSKAITIR